MLDALGAGVLLVGPQGDLLHPNAALEEMGRHDPEMDRVQMAMKQAAAAASAGLVQPRLPPARQISTGSAQYRMNVSLLAEEIEGRGPAVLVALDRLTPTLQTAQTLRERFGLTPQQARVALLLAEGLPDKAISEELCISPHTARNHSKRVLEKLGVHTRASVRPMLANGV